MEDQVYYRNLRELPFGNARTRRVLPQLQGMPPASRVETIVFRLLKGLCNENARKLRAFFSKLVRFLKKVYLTGWKPVPL